MKKIYRHLFLAAVASMALASCTEEPRNTEELVDPWLRERTPVNLRLESQIGAAVITDNWRNDEEGSVTVSLITGGLDMSAVKVVALDFKYPDSEFCPTASIAPGSTLDFSNEALQAAEKGLKRIMQAAKDLRELAKAAGVVSVPAPAYGEFISAVAPDVVSASNADVKAIVGNVYEALCDDLNTPIALSNIFDAVRIINTAKDRKLTLDSSDWQALVDLFDNVVFGVLGLRDEESEGGKATKTIDGLMQMVLEQRKAAKAAKDWATSDRIRDELKAIGIQIKDTKEGTEWTLE